MLCYSEITPEFYILVPQLQDYTVSIHNDKPQPTVSDPSSSEICGTEGPVSTPKIRIYYCSPPLTGRHMVIKNLYDDRYLSVCEAVVIAEGI